MRIRETGYSGVYTDGRDLYTLNLVPGTRAYDETVVSYNGKEYRLWNPKRSKMSAALKKGLKNYSLERGSRVLYLGAANGTTVSHISDIVTDGMIYAVEISHRAMRDLLEVARVRHNIFPVLGNARKVDEYISLVDPAVDILYQDVAQRDQVDIFLRNADVFLHSRGTGYLMLKTRSVDVALSPEEVLKSTISSLEDGGMEIKEILKLSPYERDHYALVMGWKG